jgi:hypothetical protein
MGCDIHMVLEYHDERNDVWVGLHEYPYINLNALKFNTQKPTEFYKHDFASWRIRERNYELFAEIASVRGKSSQGLQARGLPDDCSTLARCIIGKWKHDAHNASWLSVEEFIKCMAIAYDEITTLVAERLTDKTNTYDRLLETLLGEDIEKGSTDKYRIVFWFDN